MLCEEAGLGGRLADLSDKKLRAIAGLLNRWRLRPGGTEGFRTAEVTAGGIDTAALSSKTFAAKQVPGLYFIGECLAVTRSEERRVRTECVSTFISRWTPEH